MPTGYTYGVQEGKVADFAAFAMQCARAFGACIEMRDEPGDSPIPEEFKPSSYHAENHDEACKRLNSLQDMNVEQIIVATEEANRKAREAYEEAKMRKTQERHRYEAMLEKTRAWTPPTADHEGLKDFMIQQLADSIAQDCYEPDEPKELATHEWYLKALTDANWNVDYHAKEREAEIKRASGRTEWIKALRESLK